MWYTMYCVTRYEKTYHSKENMIFAVRGSILDTSLFFHFFFLYRLRMYGLDSFAKFHANPTMFSDSNSPEKEEGSVLASYVN